MDFNTKIDHIITLLNEYEKDRNKLPELVKEICELFDLAVYENKLSDYTIDFLYYLSNFIGIPQYFDLLCHLKKIEKFNNFKNQSLFGSLVNEAKLHIDKETKIHNFQKEIIDKFDKNKQNRFIITAPTSFGKTFIIYYLVEKMKYKNVVLIFPTIALLSENIKRIIDLKENNKLNSYKVITLSEEEISPEGNILILTPERFMSFIDINPNYKFDFMFYDEIYKIDNDFLSDDNEFYDNTDYKADVKRDIAFRIALEMGLRRGKDILLAGPFMFFDNSITINNFIKDNKFLKLNYNSFELVAKKSATYKEIKKKYFDGLDFTTTNSDKKKQQLFDILYKLKNDGTIVYCSQKHIAEKRALATSCEDIYEVPQNDILKKLINHLSINYSAEWCVVKALKKGIGVHHGTIPKYVQKEIINLFNDGIIKCIFSTTTITEGVNTTAKNIVILNHKKGLKPLRKFDVLNIMGRAGRFTKHFSGRIFILDEEISKIIKKEEEQLKHINYGLDSKKEDVDIKITNNKYLNSKDHEIRSRIIEEYDKYMIPQSIRDSFLTIRPKQKVILYKEIKKILENNENEFIEIIEGCLPYRQNKDRIQDLISIIRLALPKDNSLYRETEIKEGKTLSPITHKVYTYLISGFRGLIYYKITFQNFTIDRAIRKTNNEIFTLFRYELVKYISLIDAIYKEIRIHEYNENEKEIKGFGPLLSYLEYGAYTENGRKASDYGLPASIIKYIDNNEKGELDEYEIILYNRFKLLL